MNSNVTQVQSLHCCGSINASFVVASKGVIDQFGAYYPLSYIVVLKNPQFGLCYYWIIQIIFLLHFSLKMASPDLKCAATLSLQCV